MKTLRNESGFTLIELIMIIVIVAILAAVAIPKYADLTDKAVEGTGKGITGALRAAAAINYANCILRGTATTSINAASVVAQLEPGSGVSASGTDQFTAVINGKTYTWTFTAPTQITEPTFP